MDPIVVAINHFKAVDGDIRCDNLLLDFLEKDEYKAVFEENGYFRSSLYKVFLFLPIASAIKSGNLNLTLSYKYRPLDDYLTDPFDWQRSRNEIIERAG